jgi:hypothetical protein
LRGISDPYHLRFSPDMKWFVTAANRLTMSTSTAGSRQDAADAAEAGEAHPAPETPSHLFIDSKSTTLYASHAGQRRADGHRPGHAGQAGRSVGKMPADIYLTPTTSTAGRR